MNTSAARLLGLTVVVLLSLGSLLVAQEGAAERSSPAASPGAAAATDSKALKEQEIYTPYKELWKVFERERRGVFMPYKEFMELWRAAQEKQPPAPDTGPPVAFLISEASNVATVAKDSEVVNVSCELKIELLKAGWHEVPLRLEDSAITRAVIGNEPARLVAEAGQGYRLLIEKKGDQPQTITLKLEFAKAFSKAPGQNSVSFQCPQAPVSRWQVQIPETGVKVNIEPFLAATEVPSAEKPPEAAKETRVLAFVGAAPTVRIGWTPKAEGAKDLAALATVETTHRVTIEEGVVRSQTELLYDISRAELPTLLIEVPADQKVVNVFDPNVRQWAIAKTGAPEGFQRVEASLFEPAKNTQRLTVELEKYDATKGEAAQKVTVPIVRAVGVVRQQGAVAVRVGSDLRAEAVQRAGLLQLDAGELPAALRNQSWDFAYRYAALPFALEFQVEKIKPRILVESLVEVRLAPEELDVDLLAVYTIEKAGVFRLELVVPEGFEVREVRGHAVGSAAAVQVESHHLEAASGGVRRLVVNLARKALGRAALAVRLKKQLSEPDLLTPTGQEAKLSVTLPRVAPEAVEQDSGKLVLFAPEVLRVTAQGEGLRKIDTGEALALAEGRSAFAAPDEQLRPILAFAYGREKAVLALAAERRAPQVTMSQLLVARVETGVVKFDATFYHEIRYGTVKTLRIDVPAELAKDLRVTTTGVTEKPIEPPPADVAQGYVALSFTGEKDFAGDGRVTLSWEKPIDKLDIGASVELSIPHLKPRDGRAWGQIVLTKVESINLRPLSPPEALQPIDPQLELMRGTKIADAAWAYRFSADWTLKIEATLYKLQEIKWTSIERAVVRMVLTRSGEASVQALYRMRSAQQRLLVELPQNVQFDRQALRLNGQPVSLEQGDQTANRFFIPLTAQSPDEPFVLELAYTIKGVGLGAPRLDLPVFAEGLAVQGEPAAQKEPAIQKVFLSVYLPEDRTWLGTAGPWTNEMVWAQRRYRDLVPQPRYSDAWLVNDWLLAGVKVGGSPLDRLATDGRRHLFSALQPAAAPGGSLRLVAMSGKWLAGIVLAIILAGGLVLLPCRAATRWLAVGAAIVLGVAAAVFLPTFAHQLVTGATAGAALIVLVVWLVWYLAITWPRRRRERRLMMAVSAPPGPSGPVAGESPPAAPTTPGPEAPASSDAGSKADQGGENHA